MAPALEVHHLSKSYGDHVAVRDISFSVEPGEVFCLLGPNGAGKTTTTEILEGYRSRSGGEVSVLGFDPGRAERELRRRIGIVLQDCGSYDELTVAEVLDMFGHYADHPMDPAEVMELVELDARPSARVGRLSGGQRRRLDIGLALIGRPDVLFLDEPTTGFDPAARRNSWSMIHNLTGGGMTVLLTTHFMDEAQALADRVAVVVDGAIVATGAPETLGRRDGAASSIDVTIPGVLASDLPRLAAARLELHGDRLHLSTDDAVGAVHALTGWALDHGVALVDLTVTRPTLEDVYLELTGSAAGPATTDLDTTGATR